MIHTHPKIMNILLILLSLFLFPAVSLAGELETLVRDLQSTYQSAQNWQADFKQTTFVDLTGQKIQKKGEIFVSKPGKLRINYEGESARQYISNGKRLWIYSPGDSQVEVYKNVSKIMAKEALSFLQGLGNIQSDFKVSLLPRSQATEALIQDKNLKLLSLTPRDANSPVNQIIIGYDPTAHRIEEATLLNESGNKSHYQFSGIQLNGTLTAGLFEFDKPTGVKEIRQ